jgi:hypothetical protein
MRLSDMKARRKQETGTDMKLFLGLDYESEGFMHIKPPRNCAEYEQMAVSQICRRIQDDVEELVARAYPAYGEEWAKKFAPGYWQWRYAGFSPCRHITEKLANKLRHGLWKEINSTDSETAKKAQKEMIQLLDKYLEAEPKHAANALAFVTKQAATWLENLSAKRAALMKEVAREFSLWPVNMGLRPKVNNKAGKRKIEIVLTRRDFAEEYLKGLGVNTDSRLPESAYSGADVKSPFRIAAEQLYTDLLLMKRNPPNWHFLKKGKRGWVLNMTPWAKKLFALQEPMTTANVGHWWKVAKFWLDERWEANRDLFRPLIGSCKSKGKPLTEAPLFDSEVKSHVIDLRLREAFFALAKPADL